MDRRAIRSALVATNKAHDSSQLSFQLPTTSANYTNHASSNNNNNNNNDDDNLGHHHHQQTNQNIDVNNNINDTHNHRYNHNHPRRHDNLISSVAHHLTSNGAGQLTDYCHHQAATSFLFNHQQQQQHNLSEQPLTTESEQSVTPPPHYHEIPGIVPSYQGRTSGPPPAYDEVMNPNAPPPTYQSLFGQVREARKRSNGLVDLSRQLFLILIGTIGCTMIIGFLLLIPITMILVGFFYVNECRAENIPTFLIIGGVVWIIKNVLNCYNQFKRDSSTVNRPPPRRTPISNSSTNSATTSTPPSSVLIVPSNQTATTTTTSDHDNSNSTINNQRNNSVSNSSAASNHSSGSSESSSTDSARTITLSATTRIRTMTDVEQHVSHIRNPPMIGLTSYKCESILNYFLIVWFWAGCIVVYRIYEPDYENLLSASYCNRTVYLYAFWLMNSAFIIMAIVLSCLCCLMASSLMSCNHGR